MNKLFVGTQKDILLQHLPERDYLLVADSAFLKQVKARARTFDVHTDTFNPLDSIDHKRARELATILYACDRGGDNTLTARNGKRALAQLALSFDRLDEISGNRKDPAIAEALGMIDYVLFSPVVKRILCSPTNFSLDGTIHLQLNRDELGREDSFIIANLLISLYKGTVIIPDFGFYGHKGHADLIEQGRLLAGIVSFSEIPELRQQLELIPEKIPSLCTFEDATILALYKGLVPDPAREDCDYNKFIRECTGGKRAA